jgi:hypothetical protein
MKWAPVCSFPAVFLTLVALALGGGFAWAQDRCPCIHGSVSVTSGQPNHGLTVWLVDLDGRDIARSEGVTDSAGRFSILELPSRVLAGIERREYALEFYDGDVYRARVFLTSELVARVLEAPTFGAGRIVREMRLNPVAIRF